MSHCVTNQNPYKKTAMQKHSGLFVVRPTGFEPAAFRVGAERSIHLSYGRRSAESRPVRTVSGTFDRTLWCNAYSTTFFRRGKAFFQKSRQNPVLRPVSSPKAQKSAGGTPRPRCCAKGQLRCSTGQTARLRMPDTTKPAAASTAPCTPTNSSTNTSGFAAPRADTKPWM